MIGTLFATPDTTVEVTMAVESRLPVSVDGVADDCAASYVATVKVSDPTDEGTASVHVRIGCESIVRTPLAGPVVEHAEEAMFAAYGCGVGTATPFCDVSVTTSDCIDADMYCDWRAAEAVVDAGSVSVNVATARACDAAPPLPTGDSGTPVDPPLLPPPHAASEQSSAQLTNRLIFASISIGR
jgi:hypothetical protein